MSKILIAALVVATGALALTASEAQAGTIQLRAGAYSQPTGISSNGATLGVQGGEFKVTSFDGGYFQSSAQLPEAGSYFQTFCLERDQQLSGATNWTLNTAAVTGGAGGGNPDPLSTETAKLYYAFWADAWTSVTLGSGSTLSVDYDYANSSTGSRAQDAADLQLALWFLEDEILASQLNAAAADYVAFAQAVSWSALGQQNWSGIGDVRVLNLFDSNGAHKQDVLVVVPLPPAALSGLALLGGLGLLGLVRRRRALHRA